MPTLALHLPRLWQFAVETGIMVILPLLAHGRGIQRRNVYYAGNYQLRDKNLLLEWDSAGNYQLKDKEST
jgi:hypothetical protein